MVCDFLSLCEILVSADHMDRTEMAPFAKSLPPSLQPPSADFIATLEAKNEEQLKKFDLQIKDAEESLGETDPAEGMREKAGYLCQIGDKVSSASWTLSDYANRSA